MKALPRVCSFPRAIPAAILVPALVFAACAPARSTNPRDYAVSIRDVPQTRIHQSYKQPARGRVWVDAEHPDAEKAPPMAGGIKVRVHND